MSTRLEDRSRQELEEERDFLLSSLDDLERERVAGDIEDRHYLALKDEYTARAAAVLRALERAPGSPDSPFPASAARSPRRRRRRSVLVAAAVAALAVAAGSLAARSAGERLPGAPTTGEIAATGPSDDLARARALIGQGRTLDAIKVYDDVLAEDPRQPEALAYRGWLLRLAGRSAGNQELVDKGGDFVDQAVAADPTYPDARFFRGFVLYQDRNDRAGAVAEFRAFLANRPPREMVPVVEDLLRRVLAEAGQAPPPSG